MNKIEAAVFSKTINFGAEAYPFPREDIPMDSKDMNGLTLAITPKPTSGLTVVSVGKL